MTAGSGPVSERGALVTTTDARSAGGLDRGWPTYAGVGIVLALLLTAVGTFTNLGGEAEEGGHTVGEYLVVVGMIAVGALVVFGLVAKVVTPANAGAYAVGFGLVGLLSVLVFWTGLPAVLAVGALACVAVDKHADGSISQTAKVGAVLALLVLAMAVALAIVG